MWARTAGGPEGEGVSRDQQESMEGDVFISGWEVSAGGEGPTTLSDGGAVEEDALLGVTVLVVSGASRSAGWGSLVGDAVVGVAGVTRGADAWRADGGGCGAVWGAGQRRVASWRLSLSRAVF